MCTFLSDEFYTYDALFLTYIRHLTHILTHVSGGIIKSYKSFVEKEINLYSGFKQPNHNQQKNFLLKKIDDTL